MLNVVLDASREHKDVLEVYQAVVPSHAADYAVQCTLECLWCVSKTKRYARVSVSFHTCGERCFFRDRQLRSGFVNNHC